MSIHTINPATIRLTTADLNTSYRLILWAMRRWVRNVRLGKTAEHEIRQGLACFGVGSAARSLDDTMMCIGTGAVRSIEIRCDGAVGVSADEYRLLRALQTAAAGQAELCNSIPSGMVTPTAGRVTSQHCHRLAIDLIAGLGDLEALPAPRVRNQTNHNPGDQDAEIIPLFGNTNSSAA